MRYQSTVGLRSLWHITGIVSVQCYEVGCLKANSLKGWPVCLTVIERERERERERDKLADVLIDRSPEQTC